jgi:hypothetical protein
MVMVAAGTPLDIFGPDERTARDRVLQAGGVVTMVAGFGTLVYSTGKLVKNRRDRRRLCDSSAPPRD